MINKARRSYSHVSRFVSARRMKRGFVTLQNGVQDFKINSKLL